MLAVEVDGAQVRQAGEQLDINGAGGETHSFQVQAQDARAKADNAGPAPATATRAWPASSPPAAERMVFLSCSLNRRRALAAASAAAGGKKNRMEKRAKMVEEAMHACMYYVRAKVELMIIVGYKYT